MKRKTRKKLVHTTIIQEWKCRSCNNTACVFSAACSHVYFPDQIHSLSPILVRGLQIMRNYHHYPDLRVTDIAKTMHLSVRKLQSLFHKELHYIFRDYLSEMRLSHARKMQFERPWLTLDQIRKRVGFASKNGYYFALHKQQQKLIKHFLNS